MIDSPALPPPTERPPGFWRRRIVAPVLAQLTQGVTPDKIAATLAVGTACSMFPFLGFTSLLNLAVGIRLRMNQPILQTLNQLLGPVHLVMIVLYVRCGEWIWRADDEKFSLRELLQTLHDASVRDFVHRFGWASIHAFTAWAISVPLIIAGLYYGLRPALRRAAALRRPAP